MKYLDYIMQKNGGAEKHINERVRRAIVMMIVMKQDMEHRRKAV